MRSSSSSLLRTVLGLVILANPTAVTAQSYVTAGSFFGVQSDGSSSTSTAGASLLTGTGPLAIRGNAYTSLGQQALSPSGVRPWGLDADVLLSLGGGSRMTGPYLLASLGVAARDSSGVIAPRPNWSYGGGLLVPLGRSFDAMVETRYTLNQFSLPGTVAGNTALRQFRLGLSLHLDTRRSGSSRSVSLPSGGGSAPVAASASASRVLATGDQYLGVKYVYGGTSPVSGFDCSGFTQYVFAKNNVRLPRTSRQQAQVGTNRPAVWSMLAPGDLVMFAEADEPISHVAIYAGNNRIIHSTSSGGGVRYDDLTTSRGQWFVRHMVAARRVLTDGRKLVDFAKAFAGIAVAFDPPDKAPPIRR